MILSHTPPSFRAHSVSPRSLQFAAAMLLLITSAPTYAQGTHLWTQSRFDEFEKGTPQGVDISSDGKLHRGPLAREVLTTPSTFVWSVAVDQAGTAYLATGSPSSVLRVGEDGKTTTLFETKALAVQVLRVGPDRSLYAATLPDGKVYRIKADALTAQDDNSAELVFDLGRPELSASELAKRDSGKLDEARPGGPGNEIARIDIEKAPPAKNESAKPENKSRYIWDMTFDTAGRLYVATGGPGAVYRLDLKLHESKPELFFKSDEQHIRTLAWDKAGNLLAGTDGSGLVYRIDREGKGYVLFSAPRREITAIAVGADGTVYSADVGDKTHNALPALPVQMGSGGTIVISFSQPGSVQAANASTTLPEGSEIYALTPNAAPRKVWSGKDEIVYKLAATAAGLTALTGNRGRILTIRADGSFSDVAHLDSQQAVSMVETSGGWLVGTANTGKLYSLTTETAASEKPDEHSYASDVLDTGATARWGHVEVEPGSHSYQIWTRTGNVEQPVRSAKDWGWSEWQPTAEDKVASPVGRYIQWKAVLGKEGVVAGVGINYLPVNSAPSVDDILVAPGARVTAQQMQVAQPATVTLNFPNATQNTGVLVDGNAAVPLQAQKDRSAVTVRWTAHDDNGDDLTFDVLLRGDGEKLWRPLKKGLTDKVYSFDAGAIPDGGYHIKVVASDAPSHTPGDILTGELVSDRFELDTTAPVISGLKAGAAVPGDCKQSPCPRTLSIPVILDAKDASSPISHAEYSVDAGPWQYIEPVGGLSDAKEEHYYVSVPLPANAENSPEPEHLITVRVYDRHENMAAAKVIVPNASQSSAAAEEK